MEKNNASESARDNSEQESSDQAWARNRLQNEIQYLLDQGKNKEAKVLKKQLAELVRSQRKKK